MVVLCSSCSFSPLFCFCFCSVSFDDVSIQSISLLSHVLTLVLQTREQDDNAPAPPKLTEGVTRRVVGWWGGTARQPSGRRET